MTDATSHESQIADLQVAVAVLANTLSLFMEGQSRLNSQMIQTLGSMAEAICATDGIDGDSDDDWRVGRFYFSGLN